jgi:hypothetical protein
VAIVMQLEWPGATLDDYDAVMEALGLDADPPAGGLVHVCGEEGGTLRIVDVWESEDAWNAFFGSRLGPALEKTGLAEKGRPDVRVYPLHNVFAPGADVIAELGAGSALTSASG